MSTTIDASADLLVGTPASLSIAEAASASGLTTHTLRYYERDGLMLDDVDRAPSGHRRYTDEDLRWIHTVTRLRATGMPIREVREYADLVRAGTGNEAERLELLTRHRDRVLEQLEVVRGHLTSIDAKIELYQRSVERSQAG
ncbi:MAG TPA: MerR family transcriptional regulator [Actinotalea sp.]|jgi:DNA-binding transcriptional MerR regulator